MDKRADILQATFKHYYEMAMDHRTKAATISSILLILVAAIIGGVVGHVDKIGDVVGFGGKLAVFLIGVFGAAAASTTIGESALGADAIGASVESTRIEALGASFRVGEIAEEAWEFSNMVSRLNATQVL